MSILPSIYDETLCKVIQCYTNFKNEILQSVPYVKWRTKFFLVIIFANTFCKRSIGVNIVTGVKELMEFVFLIAPNISKANKKLAIKRKLILYKCTRWSNLFSRWYLTCNICFAIYNSVCCNKEIRNKRRDLWFTYPGDIKY